MKIITILFVMFTPTALAESESATFKWLYSSLSTKECIATAQKILEKYPEITKIENLADIALVATGKYDFMVNCLEQEKAVHLITAKRRDASHDLILKELILAYEEFNK